MAKDFCRNTTLEQGTMRDVEEFLVRTVDYRHYTPILATLFSKDRLRAVDECYYATMPGSSPFGLCAISHKGVERSGPEIVGAYVIGRARKLGIGTQLVRASLGLLFQKKLTPVRIGLLSEPMKKIVAKLPEDWKHRIVTYDVDYDLTELEKPILVARDWYREEL